MHVHELNRCIFLLAINMAGQSLLIHFIHNFVRYTLIVMICEHFLYTSENTNELPFTRFFLLMKDMSVLNWTYCREYYGY